MKDFRAFVWTDDIEVFGVVMRVEVAFKKIPADSEPEAKDAAKVLARTLGLLPKDVAIRCAFATDPDEETNGKEEG